jgi:glycosyltransferase involved in cell wall biosynthesis
VNDDPIRILRLIARLNVGGPSLHVTYLSAELDRRGYETVLAAGRVGAGEGSMEYLTAEHGVEPQYIDVLQRNIDPRSDALAAQKVLRLIRDFQPHILHTHTAKAGAIGRTAALLAGEDRPRAVVHTFHGHVLRGYFNPLVTKSFLQVERTLARSTDALIAVSPEVRDDLVELGVARADKIVVVRLGLDLDARTAAAPDARGSVRSSLGIPEDCFLIGWLGRMTEVKRVDHLLRAFALLRRRGVDAGLVLVGDGPLRRDMDRLAHELDIGEHAHFIGYTDEVGPLYAAFDAVALTSANEGTPVTLIESLAAGVPVVATDVGGVRDVVPDEEGGFLVPAGTPNAVADRLEVLARDSRLRERFGAAGSAFVRERYSIPRLVDDMDGLYRDLLARADVAEQPRISLTPPIPTSLPPAIRKQIPRATSRLRVLLVSQYFPPEIGATQSRMQSFAEYLAERGHRVTVIAEFPNHPQGVMPEHYHGHLIDDDRSNAYRVLRVWVKTSAIKTPKSRLAFYGSFTALASAVGPLAGRADVVLATSPPLFTGLTGVVLARMKRAPLVLDVRDLWPAAAEALDQLTGGWTYAVATSLERWLYRQSEAVVAVTRPFCEHVDRVRGRGPATGLIPNGTLELFFEANGDGGATRSSLGVPPDAFVVTFAGTHGIAQALSSVLEAAAQVDDRYQFIFIGEGPMKERLKQDAHDRSLTNVHFRGQMPVPQIPPILAASDALLVPLSSHPVFADFVPSKMIDFMAVGRPVLLAAQGESARLLERAGAGVVATPEDPGALTTAVRWLADHPAEAREMGERGREFARRRLRVVQAERLEQVLLDVVHRRRSRR